MYRRLLFFSLLALCFTGQIRAQEQKVNRDSLRIIQDSAKVVHDSLKVTQDSITFKAIEKYSRKSKLTRFIHGLFFKHVTPDEKHPPKKTRIKKPKVFRKTEGKVIREIYITTLNPFGYSLQDTAVHPRTFIIKAANSFHIKTRPIVIQNRLLFKKNEHYDSLLVNESVRLIRSQKYVRDVLLYSLPTSKKADSVDVYIRVSDVWSIVPAFSISNSSINAGLADNNLAGLGNRFEGDIKGNRTTHIYVKRFSYLIPNIRNSYISLNLQYMFPGQNDPAKNYEFVRSYYSPLSSNLLYSFSQNKDILRSIELSKTFYSPYTRWAGGLFLGQMLTAQSYIKNDTIRYLASKTNIRDFWIARAWRISRWNNDGRITSFILSGRMVGTRYKGIPAGSAAANVFNKEDTYFMGIGITSRKYIEDQYIFNYGKVEDVPVGRAFGMIVGMNVQHTQRMYLGLQASWGNVYHFGYLSTDLEYGTFIGSKGPQQGIITGRINYYTRLMNIKYWKLRQFIRPTLIFGINRLPSDNLTFTGEMKGFEKLEYTATRMLVLTLQTQSYAPWSLLGFNFGPYLFSSFGILGNEASGFSRSRIYSLFGVGVLIRNNYLTFNTFQISMTFYPYIPGNGYSIFKSNAYKTSDYGFRDFDISKPRVADY
jgi:hypothetical protein